MTVMSLDLDWNAKSAIVPLLLRIAVWMAALASCLSICQEHADNSQKIRTEITQVIPIGIIFLFISLWLLYQNRKWDIVGGPPPRLPNACMKGKVVLVTGANTGIGKEITVQLLQLGATVIMACRNMDKAQQAKQELLSRLGNDDHRRPGITRTKNLTGNSSSSPTDDETATDDSSHDLLLRIVLMDLTSLESVRMAVQQIEEWKVPIHVLINNAGIMMATRQTSVDGYELVMHANHLGHFLLTQLLLPKLLLQQPSTADDNTATPPTTNNPAARVINLTSSTYKLCHRLDVDDMFCERRPYTLFGQYAQSKLANILFTKELARRYSSPAAAANDNEPQSSSSLYDGATSSVPLLTWAVHPGVVKTDVTRNMPWYFRFGNYVLSSYIAALSKFPSQGAWGAVLCAASPNPPPNATYIRNGTVQATTPATRYDEVCCLYTEYVVFCVGLLLLCFGNKKGQKGIF
jgi:NAD(P)-dependent dehydrogenase (short-subunit alcohol dehydrogenase family)